MSTLRLNPDLVFREDSDGGLIFDPATGDVQVLNETAAFICTHLDGSKTLEEISSAVLEEFELEDAATGRREVTEFVDVLRARSMVQEV